MSVEMYVDSSDFSRLSTKLAHIPAEIKAKAFSRALRRVRNMAKTQVVRRAAKDSGLRYSDVNKITRAFNTGSDTARIVMRAGWIPLYKLGAARQTGRGVSVRKWGAHKGAFIATMRTGHTGVFVRVSGTRMEKKNKEQIRELWGPNPVSNVLRDDEKYLRVLSKVMQENFVPRVEHEINRILSRAH